MMETRVCAQCGTSLPSGMTDVFCPACALRAALAGGKPPGAANRLLRWFQRLLGQKQADKSHENPLAYSEDQLKQSAPMTTAAPAPGEVIGDYVILERIGGNMGLVFKARHQLLDKVVVLKLVPSDCIADPAHLARFQREMRAMGQLEHPNLVTAADARSVGEWHLVAMELIDGVDLQQLVRRLGPLPIAAACEAARQAALGLQYAHEHGLIHRDIKPSNLMLTRSGTIKVIDMGLALIREDSTAQLTQTGLVLGTMSYCAPEQFRNASNVDIRADIYSLGCTLYNLLAGKSPYWERKTFAEVMQAHLHDPFPSLTEARPDAPTGLEAVVARMTAKDREARFSTPRDVVEALEPFAQGADLRPLVPSAAAPSPPRRAAAGKAPPTPGRERAPRQEQRTKARWPRLAAALVALLVIAGAVMFARNPPVSNAAVPIRNPTVVVMDTTADRGVYNLEDKGKGITNGEEMKTVLKGLPCTVQTETISIKWKDREWRGEALALVHRPALVLIHRSSFFHPVNAELGFSYPKPGEPGYAKWKVLYDICDNVLFSFLGNLGTGAPGAKFLIYSRGTDENWRSESFREQWKKDVEERFPWLKGRVETMLIQGGSTASFKDPEIAKEMRRRVKDILALPDETK